MMTWIRHSFKFARTRFLFGMGICLATPAVAALPCDLTRTVQELFESGLSPQLARQKLLYPEFFHLLPTAGETKALNETLYWLDLTRSRSEFRPKIIEEFYHLYQSHLQRPTVKQLLHEFYRALATRKLDEAQRYAGLLRPQIQNIDQYLKPYLDRQRLRQIEVTTDITTIKVGRNEIPNQDEEMRVLLVSPHSSPKSRLNQTAKRLQEKYNVALIASDEYVDAKDANAIFVRSRFIQDESGKFVSRPLIVIPSSWLSNGHERYSLFHEIGHLERYLDRVVTKKNTLFDGGLAAEGIKSLRDISKSERAYSRYFSFEEFEMQARDLTYTGLGSESEILNTFRAHQKIPAHQLFDIHLVQNKLKRLKEYLGATAENHLRSVERELNLISKGTHSLDPQSLQPWLEGEMWTLDLKEGITFYLTFSDPNTNSKIAQYRKNAAWIEKHKTVDPVLEHDLYYQKQSLLNQQQAISDDLINRARQYLKHHRTAQETLQAQVNKLDHVFRKAAPDPDRGVYGAAWTKEEYLQAKDELSRVIRDLKRYSKQNFGN